jgi:hypothetical protein
MRIAPAVDRVEVVPICQRFRNMQETFSEAAQKNYWRESTGIFQKAATTWHRRRARHRRASFFQIQDK